MSQDKKTYRTLSPKEIRDYLEGKVTGKDAHSLEKHLLNDAFDREAVEGYDQFSSENILSDVKLLKDKIGNKKRERKIWMKVAATIALLMVSVLIVWVSVDFAKDEASKITMKEADGLSNEQGPAIANEIVPPEIPQVSVPPPIKQEMNVDHLVEQVPMEEDEADDTWAEEYEEVEPVEKRTKDLLAEQEILDQEVSDRLAKHIATEAEHILKAEKESAAVAKKRATSVGAGVSRSSQADEKGNELNVYGQVTDDSGEPLPGVTVVVKGSTSGTVTDMDGNYQIGRVPESAVLQFSFVGFEPMQTAVNGRQEIYVEMEADISSLSEVVVIGYSAEESTEVSYESTRPIVGSNAYKDYLKNNLIYPEKAKEKAIEGKVVLKLTISPSGEVAKVEVKRSVGYGCDEEAVRLVREGPTWKPASREGDPVESIVKVKVKFELD